MSNRELKKAKEFFSRGEWCVHRMLIAHERAENGSIIWRLLPTEETTRDALRNILTVSYDEYRHNAEMDNEVLRSYEMLDSYDGKHASYIDVNSDHSGLLSAVNDLFKFGEEYSADPRIVDHNDIQYIRFYCIQYVNREDNRWCFGISEARSMKYTLSKRGFMARLFNDTLEIIPNPVLRIDNLCDALLMNDKMYIVNIKAVERILAIDKVLTRAFHRYCSTVTGKFMQERISIDIMKLRQLARKRDQVYIDKYIYSLGLSSEHFPAGERIIECARAHEVEMDYNKDTNMWSAAQGDELNLLALLAGRLYRDPMQNSDLYLVDTRRKLSK